MCNMMMQPVMCGSTEVVDPGNVTPQGPESTDGNTMQKILRSPVTMKKKLNSKTFGIPLKELARGPTGVPVFIKKICDFIQMHGIGHEGIFRINGSSRIVDKMKAMIDRNGDTDLEEAGDVMAVASLLKLFLRELPDPVMTEALHPKFIKAQQAHQSSHSECIRQLKGLLQELPEEHYVVLHYLIRFLVMVSQYEVTNKMNSMALAIVFGPNLFRCSAGLEGLREQGITNIIVRTLIEEYDMFFKPDGKDNNLPSPAPSVGSKCIQVQAATSKRSPPVKPIPYHEHVRQREAKKKKEPEDMKDYNSNSYSDTNREELKKAEYNRDCDSPGVGLLSPRDVAATDDRAFSPFNLDSETGTSTAPSPVINDVASELVEKTIQETVSLHLFGQSLSPDRDESLTSPSPEAPVPSPRKRWQKKQEPEADNKETNSTDSPDGQSTSSIEEMYPSVRDRIRSFSSSSLQDNKSPESSPKVKRKHQLLSKAFEVFETQGRLIGSEPNGMPAAKKKQTSASGIPRIMEDPKRDRTNSRSPPSRRKAPDPPSRPSRAKAQHKSKGHDLKLTEPGSSRSPGSPKSKSPRSNSPRSNSPRSNSPRSNSPRSNSSRSNSPKSNSSTSSSPKSSPKVDFPKSRSPRSKSPKPKSLRNFRASADEKLAFEPTTIHQFASQSAHYSATQPTHRPANGTMIGDVGSEFDGLLHSSPTLKSLTAGRVAPPRNRRSPSKRKGKSPKTVPTSQQEESSLPVTEPLSIIIPSVDPLGDNPDTTQDAPQPKPRRKHSNVDLDDRGSATSQRPSGGLEAWVDERENTTKSPPRSPLRRDHAVPPLNLMSLHEHTDGEEPIPAWKARHHFHDSNQEAMLSPRSLKLQTMTHLLDQQEAPLSPRASAKPFSFESVSHDTDVPPSPPSAQPILTGISKRVDKLSEETEMMSVKQLTKQIRTLKRKIRQYEEEFEDEHGYKPSHLHKTSQPQIKKMMGELKRANKQLKEAKEDAAKTKVPLSRTLPIQVTCGRNLTQQFKEDESAMSSLETALCETEARLEEKRCDAGRPEDIYAMNKQQVQDEKTAIQKALLQMESKFGRPSTKEAKELMKHLYDRYRNVKKLLIKLDLRQPDDGQQSSLDLQTIKEHEETKEFQPKQMGEVHNLYSTAEDETMQTTDFCVTQDMTRAIGNTDPEDGSASPADSRRGSSGGREEQITGSVDAVSNLHEASLSELLAMQNQSREDKKRLRKILKEFEDDFFKKSGRYVQKEDRVPMETEYMEYKHLKKHLKLLEALVAKHQPPTEEVSMATA